jgi:hypothetical protein
MRSRYLFFINLSELDWNFFAKVMKLDGDLGAYLEYLCKLFVMTKGLRLDFDIK